MSPRKGDGDSPAPANLRDPPVGAGEKVAGVRESDASPGALPRRLAKRDVDDTSLFYNRNKGAARPLDAEGEARLVRKNFWCLLSQTWWIAFLIHLDKSTLAQASIMGFLDDVNMTKNEFNNLFVVFYAGYLIALWPGAALSQRIGHKHFITGSVLLWALLLGMHPLARTDKRQTESQIVPSTTVLHQAFFPPKKSPWVQLLWWSSGCFANVLLSMVSYKLIKDDNTRTLVGDLSPWKWLHLICAILTFIMCVPLIIFLPNTPVNAKWLSTEEKVHTITMIRDTHSGISNSALKWSQVRECFMDPKSWMFIFHMFFNELPNNTSQQVPLIIVGFGFTPAESALFNIVKPLWAFVLVLVSAAMLYGTNLGIAYTCAISYIPCFVGGIIMLAAPWSNKVALVVGTQISTFKPSYLLGLSWAGTTTTGYTKKLCVMSTCVIAAAVGNMVSPEFWQEKYKPRYVLPWSFMTAFWFISPIMCLFIRFYLVRQNKRRAVALADDGNSSTDRVIDIGGEMLKLDDDDLDQTDRENLRFRYPL